MSNSGTFYSNTLTVDATSQPYGKVYNTYQKLSWSVLSSNEKVTNVRFVLSTCLSEKGQWYSIGPTTINIVDKQDPSYNPRIIDRMRCYDGTIIWQEDLSFLNNSSTNNITINLNSTSENLGFGSDDLIISNKSFTTDQAEYVHDVDIEQDISVGHGICSITQNNNQYYFNIEDFYWEDSTPNKYVDKYVITAYSGDKQDSNDKELSKSSIRELGSLALPWSNSGAYAGSISTSFVPIAGKYIQLSLRRYKNNVEVSNAINTIIRLDQNTFYQVPGSLVYIYNQNKWKYGTPWVCDSNNVWHRGNGTYVHTDDWKQSSTDNSAPIPVTRKKSTRKKKATTN